MANPKMIAVIMVALSIVGLEVEAGKKLWEIGKKLSEDMDERLSSENQADAEKAFSLAKELIGELNFIDGLTGGKLLKAWDRILHHPDQCNEFSLGYVATISQFEPDHSKSTKTLDEATRKYASRCLTPDYIRHKLESKIAARGCFSTSCFKTKEVKFIDDQLIADYRSEYPENGPMEAIEAQKSQKAVAKAILRDPKKFVKDFSNLEDVSDYLKERLYKPCLKYTDAMRKEMGKIEFASEYLEGGFEKLFSSLDESTKKVFFRYKLCSDIKSKKDLISRPMVSILRSLSES